jgi:hypothetical protein
MPFHGKLFVKAGDHVNRNSTFIATFSAVAVVAAVACSGAQAQQEQAGPIITIQKAPETTPVAAGEQVQTIDHVSPARDSVGKMPKLFQWTAAKEADEYSIGIWNEVDRLVWRKDHITATSTPFPEEMEMEPGTYFWTVAALKGGEQIADSGLAAFVVKTDQ